MEQIPGTPFFSYVKSPFSSCEIITWNSHDQLGTPMGSHIGFMVGVRVGMNICMR